MPSSPLSKTLDSIFTQFNKVIKHYLCLTLLSTLQASSGKIVSSTCKLPTLRHIGNRTKTVHLTFRVRMKWSSRLHSKHLWPSGKKKTAIVKSQLGKPSIRRKRKNLSRNSSALVKHLVVVATLWQQHQRYLMKRWHL